MAERAILHAFYAQRHVRSRVRMFIHVPTLLSVVQSHMPNGNFVVTAAILVTVSFSFHNSALSCFILNETIDMPKRQKNL